MVQLQMMKTWPRWPAAAKFVDPTVASLRARLRSVLKVRTLQNEVQSTLTQVEQRRRMTTAFQVFQICFSAFSCWKILFSSIVSPLIFF